MRALLLGTLLLFGAGPALADKAVHGRDLTAAKWSRYDHYFRKYSKRYFGPHLDWRWFKAQAIIESNLRTTAHSSRGARGIMQIVPATFREIQRKNPALSDRAIHEPEWNIAAGIFYNRLLYQRWDGDLSEAQRISLMFASYNAGYSRVLRAFRKAGQPRDDWQAVARHLPRQTRQYVQRIRRLMDLMPRRKAPRQRRPGLQTLLALLQADGQQDRDPPATAPVATD